jgi:hypothetical protein
MQRRFQLASNIFVSCLFCLTLTLLSGCGGVSLTPVEQAEVEQYVTKHGKGAIVHYLDEVRDADLKYVKYFVSQGADVNAKDTWATLRSTRRQVVET